MLEGGPYFASAGEEVKLWDSSNFKVVKSYNFHKGNIKDLSWSRDNSFLCSTATSGDKIILVDCILGANNKPKLIAEHAIEEHQTSVRVSPSGRRLYSGGVDGAVCVWDRETGKMRKHYKTTHVNPITCITINGSETYLASGSNKGDVVIRNLSSDTTSKPMGLVDGQAVRRMEFSPWKHSLLGITVDDGSLNLWDTLQGTTYHNFPQIHSGPAMDLVFSPFNDLVLASVGLDKHLILYDVKNHKYLNKVKADQPLTAVTYMHDGYSIFAGSSLGTIYRYDLRHFSRAISSATAHSTSVQRLAVQNVAKVRKDRTRSSRTEPNNKRATTGEGAGRRQKNLHSAGHSSDDMRGMDGGGDNSPLFKFRSSSSDQSSTASSSREQRPKMVANGHEHAGKPSTVQSSTPTLKFGGRVDDMGGLISPLREEVFDNSTPDQNGTSRLQDPSSGYTFSSSVDTIGSYCDDILSPIAPSVRDNRGGKVLAGVQPNSKTSPHPLRQSHSAFPAAKPESSSKLRNSAPAPPTKSFLTPPSHPDSLAKDRTVDVRQKGLDSNSSASDDPRPKKVNISSAASAHSTETAVSRELVNGEGGATSSKCSNSHSLPPPSISAGGSSGLQIQADFLRSTVKEVVDEMGDDLRRQINGMLSAMVKLSLQQEELIQKLLTERRCDVNEQLLRECERLREENERLRVKNPLNHR